MNVRTCRYWANHIQVWIQNPLQNCTKYYTEVVRVYLLYECTYCTSVLIMYWLYECTECTSVLIVWMYWLYECTNGIDNSVPGKKCRLFYIKLCKCTMITNYDIYTIHSFKWHVCYVWDGVFALFSWLRVSKVTLIVPILEFYYMSTQSPY